MTWDHRLTLAMLRYARSNALSRAFAVFCASWLIWMLGLWSAWEVLDGFDWPVFLIALAVAIIANLILGKVKERKRPFDTHKFEPLIGKWFLGGSFPSDHAMLSALFVTAIVIAGVSTLWLIVAIVVGLLVILGRLAVGVHYTSDVVVGAFVGFVSYWLVHYIFTLL